MFKKIKISFSSNEWLLKCSVPCYRFDSRNKSEKRKKNEGWKEKEPGKVLQKKKLRCCERFILLRQFYWNT